MIDLIVERVSKVEPDEVESTRESLDRLVKRWHRRAAEQPKLRFSNPRHPEQALLIDAGQPHVADHHDSFGTMWSMRAVDTESNLYLIKG